MLDNLKLKLKDVREVLDAALNERLMDPTATVSMDETWNSFKSVVYETARKTIGIARQINEDWFDENDEELSKLIK